MNDNVNNSTRLRQGFSRVGYWLKKALPLVGIIMPIAYIGVGFLVLLSERSKDILQPINRYLLSGLLIIYGIFRAYRLIKNLKVKDEN
ncbi:MAG: hypothetical protein Q8908_04545 [Bacteroidota bacterium]|nr:hypothetical protein [Bacteroidota bacterium]